VITCAVVIVASRPRAGLIRRPGTQSGPPGRHRAPVLLVVGPEPPHQGRFFIPAHEHRLLRRLAQTAGVHLSRIHPHMLRHTFVTTMLDAGVDLRDVQIAARDADPRTTMRYDRARKNLDRHPNYILAAYMASGT